MAVVESSEVLVASWVETVVVISLVLVADVIVVTEESANEPVILSAEDVVVLGVIDVV